MAYALARWDSAILFSIAGGVAVGLRGHGEHAGAVDSIRLALDEPSLVSAALVSGEVARDATASAAQDELARLLGDPIAPTAVPIVGAHAVRAVIVVGDPRDRDVRDAVHELHRLADALGAAYTRSH
jgi:hypothetical protein